MRHISLHECSTVEWNHLVSDIVHAERVEGFKSARH